MESTTTVTPARVFTPVPDTFVSVARHGSRWGCYMQLEDDSMSWIGEWRPTKAAAMDYARANYRTQDYLVSQALFARTAALEARKTHQDYYSAPGFNHARYAELVDATRGAESAWNRACDMLDSAGM